jgi:WD40 repeat protein
MVISWLLYMLLGIGGLLTTEPVSPGQSILKIVYQIRIYQTAGPSREQWREMAMPGIRDTPSRETKKSCKANSVSPSDENKTKAEQLVGQHGKLITWSTDGTMFAYVDRNPAIPPPKPNPWGCDDCFYADLKVVRASDATLLATIRLPEFGEHWNYPTDIAWSPDGRTLLVGAEAGSSDSHFSDYWLVDWTKKDWRYAGGGNSAQWSPNGSEIIWSTPRRLEPLGKLHVWVVHLALLDVRNLKQQMLTSGTSIVSDFYWCAK